MKEAQKSQRKTYSFQAVGDEVKKIDALIEWTHRDEQDPNLSTSEILKEIIIAIAESVLPSKRTERGVVEILWDKLKKNGYNV